ncbi:MAG: hypothetical protein M1837_002413 [Sclerophora amabilis]|nr:MAG: hypothetical protein M1837_002413 [Sclerophora amabilis]
MFPKPSRTLLPRSGTACSTLAHPRLSRSSRIHLDVGSRAPGLAPTATGPTVTITSARTFHRTVTAPWPRKDSQDKDSINTEATEYSKSGTDDQAAQQDSAAFDPSLTAPESQKERAGEGDEPGANPLDVSPANPEVSKTRGDKEGGAENGARGRERTSGGGSPKKNGKA